jgi:hypothetical protein
MNHRFTFFALSAILGGSDARSDPTPSAQQITAPVPVATNQLAPHILDEQNLAELLAQLFPDRKDEKDSAEYEDLVLDFQHFGFRTIEDVRKIISDNLRAAEEKEASQYEGTATHAPKDTKGNPVVRKQWFRRVGMARIALENHVGSDAYVDYEIQRPARPPLKSKPKMRSGVTASNAKTVRALMRTRFEEISSSFVKGFFNGRKEVEKEHLTPLKKYLSETMTYEVFEREMIEADKRFAEHGGRPMELDEVVDGEPTSNQAIFLATASQMTVLTAFSHLSVYQHEFIDPTAVQKRLFAKASDFDQKIMISAIREEVPLSDFQKKYPKTKIDSTQAKIFFFRTPEFTWEQMFGREGYLIVVDDRITEAITTSLN